MTRSVGWYSAVLQRVLKCALLKVESVSGLNFDLNANLLSKTSARELGERFPQSQRQLERSLREHLL